LLLLALFALWVLIAWPSLSQQFAKLESSWDKLGDRTTPQRASMLDYPAYGAALQVKRATPDDACILFLAYTGPEHVNFFKTRFDYYLYPRHIKIYADSGAIAENCPYLVVFHDADANLSEEPFRGVWNEEQLRRRVAGMEHIQSGRHIEIYRSRP